MENNEVKNNQKHTEVEKKRTKEGVLEKYDFNRPDKFNQENLKSFEFIANVFARKFSQMLSNTIGSPINVMLDKKKEIEQIPYASEYIEKMPVEKNVFCIVDMGYEGMKEMIIEVDLAFARFVQRKMISRKNVVLEDKYKKLSIVEVNLFQIWINKLLEDLENAFQSIVPLDMEISKIESEPKYIKITTPQDMVAVIPFSIEIEEKEVSMRLCIPYLSVRSIIEKLTTENVYEFAYEKEDKQQEELLKNNIKVLQQNVSVELGKVHLTVRELLQCEKGDTLMLDKVKKDLIGKISNLPKFSCRIGRKENRMAVKVTGFAKKGDEDTNG